MAEGNKVSFEIRLVHDNPVDLVCMAQSLISLDTLSRKYISIEHGVKDSKILLESVHEGSDTYKVIFDVGAALLPNIIEPYTGIEQVVDYIKSYLNIEKKSINEIRENKHYNSVNADAISKFIAPVEENNPNSSISIAVDGNRNNVFVIHNDDIPKIKESVSLVKSIINDGSEENTNLYKKVLIEMHKATNTEKKVKDSAYCDDILKDKAVPTIIEDPEDKKLILQDPFNNYFLVDIEVMKRADEIKLYRVTKLHNIIPKED